MLKHRQKQATLKHFGESAITLPMAAIDDLGKARYVNLETFRKNGTGVQTPVWVGRDGNELAIFTNGDSYKVKRLGTWSVGKLEPAKGDNDEPSFTSYGSAASIASSKQIILLIRSGKENKDGMKVIPIDSNIKHFGGGKFFFMNAAKVDIVGMVGGTKFALRPGKQTIIEPKEMNKRSTGFFTEFHFRKEEEARPFFSSTWPINKKARSMVFFFHDTRNKRLRMHTIRDYVP